MQLESIAFIPDGNRRYAQKAGVSLLKSYQLGTQKAWEVFDWLNNYKEIKVGTFWSLSLENFKRTREIPVLFKIFEKELDKVKKSGLFERNGIKLKFIGRKSVFPKKLREKMLAAEEFTSGFSNKLMNVALGYSGQAEIVDAAKAIALDYQQGKIDLDSMDEEKFHNYLYSDFSDPDLIVRTSGVQRLSGFLPYQSAYSELYFLGKYWPEMTESDLDTAIQDFYARKRNFGK
jgi:undecaprenyl diphosphate synthase